MAPSADVTVRLATPRDVAGIVDLESRYYVDNLDAAARAESFISVLHSAQWFAKAVDVHGKPIAAQRWALRGPVCIDEAFRGCGIYGAFNSATGKFYRNRYELGVVFVAADNPRSLHTTTTKLGARSLAEFEVDSARYHLLAFGFGDSDST